jgi:translation initiation factor IF-2
MSAGAKMRVYEIAREVGIPNKELIAKIRGLGLEVNNHMSSLSADDVDRVKKSLEKDKKTNTVTKRLSSTVLRRRAKRGTESKTEVADAAPSAATPVVRRRKVEKAEEPVKAPEPVKAEAPAAKVEAEAPVAKVEAEAPAAKVEAEAPAAKVEAEAPAAKVEVEAPAKPVVIAGPKGVDIPGQPKPAIKRKAVKAAPKPQPEPEVKGPKTVEEVADNARDRFEAELQRARRQAEEREAERKRKEAEKTAAKAAELESAPTPDGRPAPGQIISLPKARIKITERAPSRPGGRAQDRGRFANQRTRGGGRRGRDIRRKKQARGPGKQTLITTPAEHKRIIRMEDTITVSELAHNMSIKANQALGQLWKMGMMGITINSSIDFDTAQLLASEFGYEVQNVAFKEEDVFESKPDAPEDLELRAPVVTVMGHVDHGKTSLLDYIRNARVAAGEAGGITQHIGAYRVDAGGDHGEIVFLDTPGHAAFTEMRARGAQATDIVILVVAADDGAMPQTVEAVNHAKDANVQIIVAVNKCDLPGAQPERIRQQLADHGLIPEEWGGDTMYFDVSAHTGEGIDKLLEGISLTAELLELQANPDKPAQGIVIEAKLDRSRGPMSTILVQEGTLRVGDIVVVGEHMGKVRAMLGDRGQNVEEAGPATPVEVLGIDGVPEAGEILNATEDEKKAKQVVEHRRQAKRKKELASSARVSLENLMGKMKEGESLELKVVLKADVHGSTEALRQALEKQSTDRVNVNVISSGVGGITESDVNLANAGGAIIVGFHVRPAGKSAKLAEQEGVEIKIYDVIYDAIDDVRAAMAGLLPPIRREQEVGQAEVRDTFVVPRRGTVAGCMVKSGKIERKSLLRVVRDAVQVFEGKVGSLRRFKDDVSEVKDGFECGIMVDGFNDIQVGDIIEAYEVVEEAATL